MNNKKIAKYIVLILTILIALIGQWGGVNDDAAKIQAQQESDYKLFLIDSLKAKDSLNTVEKLVLQTSVEFLRNKIDTQNYLIERLKQVVKTTPNIEYVTVIKILTRDTGSTRTIVKIDTITNQPIYTTCWDEKWSSGCIKATEKQIKRDLNFKNEFTVWQSDTIIEGRNQKIVNWRNLNPLSSTQQVFSWTVSQPQQRKKHFGLGVQLGYGLTIKGVQPYIGLGINYNIVNF